MDFASISSNELEAMPHRPDTKDHMRENQLRQALPIPLPRPRFRLFDTFRAASASPALDAYNATRTRRQPKGKSPHLPPKLNIETSSP
jgi:hypothetical protein